MQRAVVIVAWVLVASAGAGCLGSDAPLDKDDAGTVEAPMVEPAFAALAAALADLPCTVPSVSKDATSANLRMVGHHAVDEGAPVPTHGELDRQGSLLVEGYYNHEGFSLVDVKDPAQPEEVGSYLATQGRATYDVKFSRDQPLVFLGLGNRIQLVDVSDPASPTLVDELVHPPEYRGQAHMVFPYVIGDTEYLFVVPSVSGTGVLVAQRTGTGADAALELVTVYTTTAPHAAYPQALAPHDVFATYDDVLGHHVLYAANGFNGIVVLNVDDPRAPETLASLPPAQAEPPTGLAPTYYHSIQVAWLEGKRMLATSSEVGYNTMKVFDATDLNNIAYLGEWVYDRTQPANMQHNLQIVDGKLFMGHYERGMFVFDLAAIAADPTTPIAPMAHYQPPAGGLVWDVLVWNGVVFLSDIPQGLHVVGFGCFTPGDPTLTSRG